MKFKLPDTIILLLGILLLSVILTWIIPSGEFDRVTLNNKQVVSPGSYHLVESNPANLFDFLLAPIKGFIASAQIIVFIFFVAGSFNIINRTGAINAGLGQVVQMSKRNSRKRFFVIPVLTILFSLGGATFGMSEEVLVFVLITIPLAFTLGYDSFIGVGIPFIGAGAGFASAFLNPFTVGIAQGIAELAPFSGAKYRIFVWVLFTLVAIIFLMFYAYKIEKSPKKSLMYKKDKKSKFKVRRGNFKEFTFSHKLIITLFIFGIFVLIYGVNKLGWYINEISALFVVIGVLSALIYRLSINKAIEAFTKGASDMMKVCFVIAIARGILVIATDAKIIDTILFSLSDSVKDFPKAVSIQLMFFLQSILNFFIPSGSGQAALTMPIMSPLSDLIGISRQTAVLAFQLGDGLSNMIIPTSGVTMGVLTLANIPYQKWLKWVMPLMVIFFVLAIIVLLPPVLYFNW